MEDRGPAAYAAEFVGTFALVLFIALILSVQGPVLNQADFAVIGLVHVFTLAMLIAAKSAGFWRETRRFGRS